MSETQDNILWSLVLQPLVTNVGLATAGLYCWLYLLAIYLTIRLLSSYLPSLPFSLFLSPSLSLIPPSLSLSLFSLYRP